MATGIDGFAHDLGKERKAIGARAPVYDRILGWVGQSLDGPVGARLGAVWAGREFRAFYDRPLLLLAALRDEALRDGPAHPLWAAIGAPAPAIDSVTPAALEAALAPERTALWATLADHFVQTNETSRAVAWLWPVALTGDAGPLALVDIGCSAGLNLVADRLPSLWNVPVPERVDAVLRLGLDARPLDVADPAAARWLEACVWPGETARLERLQAAIAAFRAAGTARLETCLVSAAPARLRRVRADHPDARIVAYQTLVRDYLEPDELIAYERGMRAWLAGEQPGRALWLELEIADDATPALPCGLVAHRAGADDRLLGRMSYHPGEVTVTGTLR